MAFWKKIFKSKYTGAEIDAAVAKAGTVPTVTEADAGKALVVDEEGKIVAGEAGGGGGSFIDDTWLTQVENEETSISFEFAKLFNNVTALNDYVTQISNYYASGKRVIAIASVVESNDSTISTGDKLSCEINGYRILNNVPDVKTGVFYYLSTIKGAEIQKEIESEEPYLSLYFSIQK